MVSTPPSRSTSTTQAWRERWRRSGTRWSTGSSCLRSPLKGSTPPTSAPGTAT
nr:MAG TPA: hypothetical protein [Caudoviricetes sp.]